MTETAAPAAFVSFCTASVVLAVVAVATTFFAVHSIAARRVNEPTPFCAEHGRLENYLDRSGFTADDRMTFTSGATFQRYRYLGDVLWVAHWPNGKSCLLANGLLKPSSPFMR